MKTSHIIVLVVIAIAAAIIVTTFDSASTYVNFQTAREYAQEGNKNDIHVVGQLTKNESGEIQGLEYNPTQDPNITFLMVTDSTNQTERVTLLKPKPTDIEKTEKIVLNGHYEGDNFIAKDLLMKCPSKYNETEIKE